MNDQLKLLDEPDYDPQLSQWFTPPELAAKIVSEWRDLFEGRRVLEPSAGRGDLVRPLVGVAASVLAIEIDRDWYERLCDESVLSDVAVDCMHADFFGVAVLHAALVRACDVALMNPPYEGGLDLAFLTSVLKRIGEAVCILRSDALAGVERHEKLWSKYFLRRLAILPRRPAFSGQSGAQSDFCVVYVSDEPGPQTIEWWLL